MQNAPRNPKIISLTQYGNFPPLYHTLKKTRTQEPRVEETPQKIITTNVYDVNLTGYYRGGDVKEGDEFHLQKEVYKVVKINEIRDHNGVFKNPEDAKNSYYNVQCEFVEVIENIKATK